MYRLIRLSDVQHVGNGLPGSVRTPRAKRLNNFVGIFNKKFTNVDRLNHAYQYVQSNELTDEQKQQLETRLGITEDAIADMQKDKRQRTLREIELLKSGREKLRAFRNVRTRRRASAGPPPVTSGGASASENKIPSGWEAKKDEDGQLYYKKKRSPLSAQEGDSADASPSAQADASAGSQADASPGSQEGASADDSAVNPAGDPMTPQRKRMKASGNTANPQVMDNLFNSPISGIYTPAMQDKFASLQFNTDLSKEENIKNFSKYDDLKDALEGDTDDRVLSTILSSSLIEVVDEYWDDPKFKQMFIQTRKKDINNGIDTANADDLISYMKQIQAYLINPNKPNFSPMRTRRARRALRRFFSPRNKKTAAASPTSRKNTQRSRGKQKTPAGNTQRDMRFGSLMFPRQKSTGKKKRNKRWEKIANSDLSKSLMNDDGTPMADNRGVLGFKSNTIRL